jgi:hypothetical protein
MLILFEEFADKINVGGAGMIRLLASVLVLMLTGCANLQRAMNSDGLTSEERAVKIQAKREENERLEKERLEWPKGKSEEEIIVKFGAPTKVENLGALRIFYYRIDKGITTTSKGSGARWQNAAFSKGKAHTIESFDETRYVFKNGVCISWDEISQ